MRHKSISMKRVRDDCAASWWARAFLSLNCYPFSVNLSKYFATDTSKITIPCAPRGQYDVLLRSRGSAKRANLVYSTMQPNQQTFSHYVQSSRIRYENRLQKRQVLLQWEKRYACDVIQVCILKGVKRFFFCLISKLDIHAMKYCIAINTEGSKSSLCNALGSIIGSEEPGRLFCSQLKTSDRVIRIGKTNFSI